MRAHMDTYHPKLPPTLELSNGVVAAAIGYTFYECPVNFFFRYSMMKPDDRERSLRGLQLSTTVCIYTTTKKDKGVCCSRVASI